MLSLISLGRGVWEKFQTTHPVIRWGGAILLGLAVLEFIGQEAISLYVQMQTAAPTIAQQKAQAAGVSGVPVIGLDSVPHSKGCPPGTLTIPGLSEPACNK